MKRSLYPQLVTWKNSKRRKPLLLRGARQVGKTYLLKMFGQQEYKDCVSFNFEEDPRLDSFFEGKIDPAEIIQKLSIYSEKKIVPGETLVIFDEIQESERALNSLKYFSEQANDYHIVAAGSLLGILLSQRKSFPVGKVNFLSLFPLTFFEFLEACGKVQMRDYLDERKTFEPIPEPFHQELIEWLKKFYLVGGMPEVVSQFAQDQDFNKVRDIQQEIITSYRLDFSKHVEASEILKLATLWDMIPGQLAKENKKFIFSAIRKSARAREYELALQWLVDAALIHKCYFLPTARFPLSASAEKNFFKVYLLDVGLLGAMSRLPAKILLEKDRLFQQFHGALTENYVAQELASSQHPELYYWASPGTAEVDFVLAIDSQIVPLEVKAGKIKGLKSLHRFGRDHHSRHLMRASLRNFAQDKSFYNLPLYAVSLIPKLVSL